MALVATELNLSDEEARWVRQYVCAVSKMRRLTIADLVAERKKGDSVTWQTIRQQRAEILKSLESVLGAQRYKHLRRIGGIGLLNDTLTCDAEDSSAEASAAVPRWARVEHREAAACRMSCYVSLLLSSARSVLPEIRA